MPFNFGKIDVVWNKNNTTFYWHPFINWQWDKNKHTASLCIEHDLVNWKQVQNQQLSVEMKQSRIQGEQLNGINDKA